MFKRLKVCLVVVMVLALTFTTFISVGTVSYAATAIETLLEGATGTVTIPAGTYTLTRKVKLSKSGVTLNGNGVIIDCKNLTGLDGSGDAITITGSSYKFIGFEVKNAGHNAICITGSGNTIQNVLAHDNKNTGINIKNGGTNTTVTGCKSYNNYDPQNKGEDADGFGVKAASGSGNKFINCESYNNSDDGWDFWDNMYAVSLTGCYAHNNGRDTNGDGNGFKLGSDITSANHVLTNCTSSYNRGCGYTQNGNTGKVTYNNCISTGNGKADVR